MSQKDHLRSLQLVQETIVERRWGQKGSPWEFNLRDMFRWCQLMQADQSPGFFSPGQHVALVYSDRMRTEADKAQVPEFRISRSIHCQYLFVGFFFIIFFSCFTKVLSVFRKVFGEDFEPYSGSRQFHITPLNLQVSPDPSNSA